ncbi:MAG: proteasome assembly chaperone family protein [Thaumarchaeota archaeon]|nr:proteasome assembly chaperone family protein [Nitrososphaerota archaeon]
MESQEYYREVEIVEVKPIDEKGFVFIEGFPDIGLVGTIAASYLVDKLKLEEVGYIDADTLPPIIAVRGEKIQELIRIYSGRRLVVVTSDIPLPASMIKPLGYRLMEWAKSKDPELFLCLSGLPEPNRLNIDKPGIFVLGSSPELTEKLVQADGVSKFRDGFIAGIKGVLLKEGMRMNVNTAIILAQSHYNYPDPGAAAEVLRYLSKLLEIEIDVAPLLESAEELKLKLRDLMRRTDQMMQGIQKSKELELPPVYL